MAEQRDVLFVIQNFEVKQGKDAAGYVEIVSPMLHSGLIGRHQLLEFNRSYQEYYLPSLITRLDELINLLADKPVVIYGAGIHTRQHWEYFSRLNVVAVADKQESLHGKRFNGVPIIHSDEISTYASDVVISSKAFEMNIEDELQAFDVNTYTLYKNTPAEKEYNLALYNEVIKEIAKFKPDILFYSPTHPQDNLPVEYWHKIKHQFPDIRYVVLWWDNDEQAENFSYLSFERETLSWCDVALDAANQSRLQRMRAGAPPYHKHFNTHKAHFHATVFDPDFFYPDDSIEPDLDVVIMGSDGGNRKFWIEFLTEAFGNRFQHIGGIYQGEKYISMAEYSNSVKRAKILVNTQTYDYRSDCKGKVREAFGCGTFLLEEFNLETQALLPEGSGYVFFKHKDELLEKLHYYLAHPEQRLAVIEKGQQAVKETFNARQWTQRVFDLADAQHGDCVYPLAELHTVKSAN